MPKTKTTSPARSLSGVTTPKRKTTRGSRSLCSPALSTASGRLTSLADQFKVKDKNMESFALSPLNGRSVLNDNTEIEEPRRKSWWRKLDENSQDVMEILEDNKLTVNNAIEEFIEIEVLSQEKKNDSLDLPESSDNESIHSIVLPQRRLFTQKENQPQKKYGHLIDNRESLAKLHKTNTANIDKTINVGTRELFQNAKRSKPIFPAALLNISPNKTAADKTRENVLADPKPQVRNIFGNRPANKRKNIFADFIASESEDEMPEIQPKVFGFQKKLEQRRISSISKGKDASPASSITTDIEMDFRMLLPSSTMVENQLEDNMLADNTPIKRARLSKLSEAKESEAGTLQTNTPSDKTKQSNKSVASKNKSKASPEIKDKSLNSSRTTRSMLKNASKRDENVNTSVKQDAKGNKSRSKISSKGVELDVSKSKLDTDKYNASLNKSQKQNKTRNSPKAIETEIESEEIVVNAINNVTRVINKSTNKSLRNTTGTNKSVNEKERTVTLKVHDKVNKTGANDVEQNEDDENNFTLEYENDEVLEEAEIHNDLNENQKDNTHKHNTVLLEKESQETEINKSKSNKSSSTNKSFQQKPAKIVEESVESQTEQYSADDNVDGNQEQETENVQNKHEEMINEEIDEAANNRRADMSDVKVIEENEQENEVEVNVSHDNGEENEEEMNESQEKAVTKSQEVENEEMEGENEEEANESDGNEESNVSDVNEDEPNENQEVEEETNESLEVEAEANESEEDEEEANESEEDEEEANESQLAEEEANESQLAEEEPNESQLAEEEANESQLAVGEANESKEDEEEANESQEAEEEANESQLAVGEANESKEDEEEANESREAEEEANESREAEEEANESREAEEEANESQEIVDSHASDEENDDGIDEDEEEPANESQVNEASANESQEVENDEEESHEVASEAESEGVEDDQLMDDSDEGDNVVATDPEISDDNQADEMEVDGDEEQESDNEREHNEHESDEERQIEEQNEIEASEEIEESPNVTHDTTGRHRKKHINKSPEVILHDNNYTDQMDSFTTKGRNTSARKTKSMIKNLIVKPSLAPARDSIGFSDGTKNSSAEGSGWDSHRTTRKTLRQTFGKDFTPRKSLRALVMEKSAKRQTEHIEMQSETVKFPLANSTEMPEDSNQLVEDIVESDHELSRRTQQTSLEMYMQKIKKRNIEENLKIVAAIRNSLKNPVSNSLNLFKVPDKPAPRRPKPTQNKPKKKLKSLIPFDELPPEMIEDMKYKPPKRFQPSNASWTTKRLYKFLENKLEAKYDYRARVRAEKLVETIYNFTKDLRRHNVAPTDAVDVLKHEFARLDIVRTHFEFYEFFSTYMPREVRIKVIPDIVNKIALPRRGIFSDILTGNTVHE